jgi:UDP-2,3-diacylglucosamine pyrophosphatase LpxH
MQAEYLPNYRAVYVISDLHLGGFTAAVDGKPRNYRIFRETAALSWLIRSLAEAPIGGATQRVALVLNGDIVDFLADSEADYFDWARALAKLQRAVTDAEQRGVWEALRAFVTSGRGDLVLVLGNHDLELALPDPQQYLLHLLTDGQSELRGRVIFAMDGAGFSCRVGDRRVLCLHGNEVDPWNAVDYGRLNLIRRALARGSKQRNRRVLEPWIPNPGTQLVIEHLNGVKRKHQWIDLLKPEEEATAMIAAAFTKWPNLQTLIEVVREQRGAAAKLSQGFLGGPIVHEDETTPLLAPVASAAAGDAGKLMRDAIAGLKQGTTPTQLADEDAFLGRQGLERYVRMAQLRVWPKGLRDVLRETLASDCTFEPSTTDDVFCELDALCGPDMDFLIAGHTHLHRALERVRQPCRYYFNSGTWTRMLQIPPRLLQDEPFRELENRLHAGSMDVLEAPFDPPYADLRMVRTTRTVVRIEADEGEVYGMLLTVEPRDNGWELRPMPDTRLPRRMAGR